MFSWHGFAVIDELSMAYSHGCYDAKKSIHLTVFRIYPKSRITTNTAQYQCGELSSLHNNYTLMIRLVQ